MEDNKQTSNAPVEDNVPEDLSIVETKIGGYVKKRRRRSSSGSEHKKHHRSTHKKNGKKMNWHSIMLS